jgi:hypothetical protein
MADWATIGSLATAGGTLILAVSTFASVRSANRSARVAQQALMVGLRPLLVTSRLEDPPQKVFFIDDKYLRVEGGSAAVDIDGDDVVYLAMSVRNAGSGIAVIRGWHVVPGRESVDEHPDLADFRRHTRDMYVPPNDVSFWQAAYRDQDDEVRKEVIAAIKAGQPLTVDVLYGDYEGGQRAISRFLALPVDRQPQAQPGDQQGHAAETRPGWLASVSRHSSLERTDAR